MRQLWMAAGFAITASYLGWTQMASGAPDPWWASKRYYAELGKRCPQKHLEYLAYGELPDIMDEFRNRFSEADRERIRKAEAQRCGPDAFGASCGNESFLRFMVKRNRLGEFAKFVCAVHQHCTAQAECEQD